ncbi:MAG: hypothetical protein JRI70_10105 [Deltaproteobacteria bacterium]|nr:hypothetical protein [Deltaproteobacteria bacterium]
MRQRTTIAILAIALILTMTAGAQAQNVCELLNEADTDNDGICTYYDAWPYLEAGRWSDGNIILNVAMAGSINALYPGCYTPPLMVYFSDSRSGTWLYEEEMGIATALPATVALCGHMPGNYNYLDYTFEVHPYEEPSIPSENALMFFAIHAEPGDLHCQWVDFGAGCGQTTPPGVVVSESTMTVQLYTPED